MPETNKVGKSITRRRFLGTTGAVAGLAAVAGLSTPSLQAYAGQEEKTPGEDQVFCGVCRGNCAGGCFLNVHVRDGHVVRTSARDLPDTRYNRICPKGLTHIYRMYHPDRIKYPMKRVGERGAGEFERISWEEAIATIAEKWKSYQAEFGPASIGYYVGSGNYATCSGQAVGSAPQLFFSAIGALKVDACVDMARGTGQQPVLGIGPYVTGNEPADLLNAKTILVWGCNPAHSQVQSMHWLLEAKEAGANLVCIDPTFTPIAAKATKHVPVRPGTDAALAMAMMNVIIREDWVDWDYVTKHSDMVFLVREDTHDYLRAKDVGGEGTDPVVVDASGAIGLPAEIANPSHEAQYDADGVKATSVWNLLLPAIEKYTPEYVAELSGISVEDIEDLARMYAVEKPSTAYLYFGLDHWVKGHYAYRAISCLAALTGNIGKKGAFCGMPEALGTNFINVKGCSSRPGALKSSGTIGILHFPEIMDEGHYGPLEVNLKSLYIGHANVAGNTAERTTIMDAVNKVEFIVMADMNMNETTKYADILLPAAHWFEQDDCFVCYSTHPYVLLQEKAVEPLFEAKSDYQICKLILEALGYDQVLNMDEFEYMKLWMDTDAARKLGITLENLQEKKAIRFVPENFVYGENGILGTATKRAQFYNVKPTPQRNWGQTIEPEKERLPYWEPPREGWSENEGASKYPYVLLWEHPRWRTHSQWWDVQLFSEELYQEPFLAVSTEDAEAIGVKTGDIVRVYNDRGYVVITVHVNPGVQRGTVVIPKGWEQHQFIEGHAQNLHSRECHPMVENGAFFDSLVNVERA